MRNNKTNVNSSDFSFFSEGLIKTWVEILRNIFMNTSQDLPEIILILSLICTVGGRYNSLFEFILQIYLVNATI